jgi:hypothetical protein
MSNEYPDYLGGSENYHPSSPVDELADRVERLEESTRSLADKFESAGTGAWGLGMAIAVALSWSRNASILWCILHGILSWIYVVYFAFTR